MGDQAVGSGTGQGAGGSSGYSHGEGTVTPDGRPSADGQHPEQGTKDDLRDHVRPEEIYGGKADVEGFEDEVEGASEDAVG